MKQQIFSKRSTAIMLSALMVTSFSSPAAYAGPTFEHFVDSVSSSGLMPPEQLKIMMDNKASFDEKLATLNSASPGDRLYLMYYIHANDESTSKLNNAMIEAARRGAKVHLMVDFLTNYTRLDMFNMMSKLGEGRIDIRFFNPPTDKIHYDSMYLTMDCAQVSPAACHQEKQEQIDKAIARDREARGRSEKTIGNGHFFSRLFLAGLSGKNPGAMKTAIFEGGTIPKNRDDGDQPMPQEKEQLKDFAQILFGAKFLGHVTDKMKLTLAMLMYGEDIGPVYQAIDNALPINTRREGGPSAKDWEEISQFTHHKLLAKISADGHSMTMINGGRNLENSYHLNEEMRSLVSKYLFADTDVKTEVRDDSSVQAMEKAIRNLFEYDDMVIKLADVNRLLPVDYIKEIETIKAVINDLRSQKQTMEAHEYSELIEAAVKKTIANRAIARESEERKKMMTGIEVYDRTVVKATKSAQRETLPDIVEHLDARDRDARVAYIENLSFRDLTRSERLSASLKKIFAGHEDTSRVRVYDPVPGQEHKSNKNIHALWVEWFKQEAAEAAAEGKVRDIVIHQGYVFFPSDIVKVLGQMMDGTINSEFINLKIMTNSIQTTDLSPINVLARHQFKAMFEYYDQFSGVPRSLKSLEIYEYNPVSAGSLTSLHSKGIFSSKSMFIGSANADVRSYETDTNNGVFIKNAPATAGTMLNHLEAIAKNPKFATNVTKIYRDSHAKFLSQDTDIVKEIAAKYKSVARRIGDREGEVATLIAEKMTSVYVLTSLILDYRHAETWAGKASTFKRPQSSPSVGGGGGAAGGGALRCENLFSEHGALAVQEVTKESPYINGRREMVEKIRDVRNNHSTNEVGSFFDRLMQLI